MRYQQLKLNEISLFFNVFTLNNLGYLIGFVSNTVLMVDSEENLKELLDKVVKKVWLSATGKTLGLSYVLAT